MFKYIVSYKCYVDNAKTKTFTNSIKVAAENLEAAESLACVMLKKKYKTKFISCTRSF